MGERAVPQAQSGTSAGQVRVLEMIASGEPQEAVLLELMRVIEAEAPGLLGSVLLLDEDGQRLRHIAAPSLPAEYCRSIDGLAIGPQAGSCGTAVYRRAQVVVEDIERDPLWTAYRELACRHGLRACWSTPIVNPAQRMLGTVALYQRQPALPNAAHERLIAMATHIAAIAVARHADDQERARLVHTLGERIKELAVHQGATRLLQREHAVEHALLAEFAALLPAGWQYPEVCVARVTYGKWQAATAGWRPTEWMQLARFRTSDGRQGAIEVAYLERRPASAEGPFLAEERKLIDSLAELAAEHFERKGAETRLQKSLSRLEELSQRLIYTEEIERRKINRELHDRVGQDLSTLNLMLDLMRAEMPGAAPEGPRKRIDDAKALLEAAIREVRNVMAELHPPGLEDLGLLAALRTGAEALTSRTGLLVRVHGKDLKLRLPPVTEISLFRIAQEALTNAAKHSGASVVDLVLTEAAGLVRLTIADDGAGFDAGETPGFPQWGLSIMRQRAQAAGVGLRVDSAPGRGTRVVVEAPRGSA